MVRYIDRWPGIGVDTPLRVMMKPFVEKLLLGWKILFGNPRVMLTAQFPHGFSQGAGEFVLVAFELRNFLCGHGVRGMLRSGPCSPGLGAHVSVFQSHQGDTQSTPQEVLMFSWFGVLVGEVAPRRGREHMDGIGAILGVIQQLLDFPVIPSLNGLMKCRTNRRGRRFRFVEKGSANTRKGGHAPYCTRRLFYLAHSTGIRYFPWDVTK